MRFKSLFHRYFFIAILLVWVLFFIARSGLISTFWEDQILRVPRLSAPEFVEVPETEFGELSEAKFVISNNGKSRLQLANFRKGCTCDILGVKEGEKLVELTTLSLAPGEASEVSFIQKMRGEIGKEMNSLIAFETNDPSKPMASITIRVAKITGGLTIIPEFINTGLLQEGQIFESFLDLFGDPSSSNEIEKVVSTLPAIVTARFIPLSKTEYRPMDRVGKQFLGRVAIKLCGKTAANINCSVQVFLKSRPGQPDIVAVNGTIAKMVEAHPEMIVLPQHSEKGPIFQLSCSARSPFRKPFELKISDCPTGFAVDLDSTQPNTIHRIKVTVTDPIVASRLASKGSLKLTFTCIFDGINYDFSIPIKWVSGET